MLRRAVGIVEEAHTYTGPKCKKTGKERKKWKKPNPHYRPGSTHILSKPQFMGKPNCKTGNIEKRVDGGRYIEITSASTIKYHETK